MVEFDVFRQNLATALLDCADRRRRSYAGGGLTGEDLKIIALFERLAADVENLDPARLPAPPTRALGQEHLSRRFEQRSDALFAQVGVTYVPKDATDLVRWMNQQALERDPPGERGRSSAILRPADETRSVRGRFGEGAAPTALHVTVATDLCAGFGIVAPMLSVWEVGQAIGQWRDHVLSASRPAVQASVLSTTSAGGERDASKSSHVVLAFQPVPAAAACQVSVRVGPATVGPEAASATIMVVPRSSNCEPPLIPSQIGDPLVTFALAASLMAGGLGALKLWGRLARRQRAKPYRHAHGAAWSGSGAAIGRP